MRQSLMIPSDAPFVAIDFETADHAPDSACAVGLVRVENLQIVWKRTYLIRPPRRNIIFTWVHGITWKDVESKPTFGELWPEIQAALQGANCLVAHNASFDRRVLQACCLAIATPAPPTPFVCTVQIARRWLGIRPARLPDVCQRLQIPLQHHDAGSDAEACAKIAIHAAQSFPSYCASATRS